MSRVTAPRLGGGQVAHFIILLSCCPLLVWEEGSLEGCCVAMYNSCSNSCMSGRERETHRLRKRERENEKDREREREGNVEGGLCCVLEAHCVCRQACVCVCVTVCMHIWPQEWGAHADIYTVTKRSIRLGIQDQIKRVLPRHHLLWFPGTLLPFSTHTDTQIYTNPHCTHNLCSEFIGFKHVCGYPVVWKYWMAWRICENCGYISRRHTHTKLRFKTKPWGQDWLI